jgi:uncharacterized protein (DUF433 family)
MPASRSIRVPSRSFAVSLSTLNSLQTSAFSFQPLAFLHPSSFTSAFPTPRRSASAPRERSLDTLDDPDFNALMSQLLSRITIDPAICHGKPVIRGLRYPVESMLEYLAAGDTIEDLLTEYPDLERDDLLACLEFAAQSLKLKSQHLVLT